MALKPKENNDERARVAALIEAAKAGTISNNLDFLREAVLRGDRIVDGVLELGGKADA
jgi:hypothetical protein